MHGERGSEPVGPVGYRGSMGLSPRWGLGTEADEIFVFKTLFWFACFSAQVVRFMNLP